MDRQIWRKVWRWTKRRHPNKHTIGLKERYFPDHGTRQWLLRGVGEGGQAVRLVTAAKTPIQRHVKVQGKANPDIKNIPTNPTIRFQGLTPELQNTFAQPIKYKLERWKDGNKPIVRGVRGNHFPDFTPTVDPEETFDNS